MKDPEFKEMRSVRERLDDRFTYLYGKHKGGLVKRPRHGNSIARCRRADKRSIKAKAMARNLLS